MWLRRASLARTAAWPYGMYCRVEISALWNARADSLSRRYAICVFRRLCRHKERPSVGTDLVQNLRDSPTKSPTHGGLMDHAAVHGGALQLGRRWTLPALTCSFVGHSLSRLGRPAWQPTSTRSIEGSGDDGYDGPDPKFRFKAVCFFRRFTSDAVVPGTSKKGRLGTKARDKGL